jgi:hypothetical protein
MRHIVSVEKGAPITKSLPEKLLCEFTQQLSLPPDQYQRDRQPLYVLPFRLDESAPVLNCAGASVQETDLRCRTVQA